MLWLPALRVQDLRSTSLLSLVYLFWIGLVCQWTQTAILSRSCQHAQSQSPWTVRIHLPSLWSCSIVRYLLIADYCLKGQWQSFGLYLFHADVLWYLSALSIIPSFCVSFLFIQRWCPEGWHYHCLPDIERVLLMALVITVLISILSELYFISIKRRSEKPIDFLVPTWSDLVDKCGQ